MCELGAMCKNNKESVHARTTFISVGPVLSWLGAHNVREFAGLRAAAVRGPKSRTLRRAHQVDPSLSAARPVGGLVMLAILLMIIMAIIAASGFIVLGLREPL